MPNLAYDLLSTALEAIASPRRNHQPVATAADTAVIRPGALDTAETDPTQLTYGQRLGNAFVELLEHLPTDALPRHGVGNATIIVTIDHHELTTGLGEATLTTDTTISASRCRRLAWRTRVRQGGTERRNQITHSPGSRRCSHKPSERWPVRVMVRLRHFALRCDSFGWKLPQDLDTCRLRQRRLGKCHGSPP